LVCFDKQKFSETLAAETALDIGILPG